MWIEDFADFASRSLALYRAAPARTRYVTKYRHTDGVLEVKVTDNDTCLKYRTRNAADAVKVEKLNFAFLQLMSSEQ